MEGQESYQPGLTPVNLSECRERGPGRGRERCGEREGRGEEREEGRGEDRKLLSRCKSRSVAYFVNEFLQKS